jgi:general secretion pathway protein I
MRRPCDGFSLLEVLVAFVILSLVLSVLMQVFSGGLRNATRAGEYQQAMLLAQSKLAGIGIEEPLEEGQRIGRFNETYRWQIDISPYRDKYMEIAAAKSGLRTVFPVKLLLVNLWVKWGSSESERSVNLKTFRLAQKVDQR